MAATTAWSSAEANELRPVSIQEQIRDSDFILVGRAEAAGPEARADGVFASVSMRVESVVRGSIATERIDFVTKGQFMEMDPDCCETSARYLLFLKRRTDGFFYGTNGPLSTFRIDGERVQKWPDGISGPGCDLAAVVAFVEATLMPAQE